MYPFSSFFVNDGVSEFYLNDFEAILTFNLISSIKKVHFVLTVTLAQIFAQN